jgi:hypothetical protein
LISVTHLLEYDLAVIEEAALVSVFNQTKLGRFVQKHYHYCVDGRTRNARDVAGINNVINILAHKLAAVARKIEHHPLPAQAVYSQHALHRQPHFAMIARTSAIASVSDIMARNS